MSVIIKGMKMPENCLECEWHEYYGGDYDWCHACRKTGTMPIENAKTQRADDCPLVALPEKHGRLVDIEALSRKMYHDAFETDTDMQKWDSGCWIRYKMFENNRDDAPTVIEAEGNE